MLPARSTRSMTPLRIGGAWRTADGRYLPLVGGGDETADPAGDPAASELVPADLEALDDSELQAHSDSLVAEFDDLHDNGGDVKRMRALRDAIKLLGAEKSRREQARADEEREREELARDVHAEDTNTDTGTDDGDGGDGGDPQPAGDPAPGEGGEGADAPQGERELVATAGARALPVVPARRGAPAAGTARRAGKPAVDKRQPGRLSLVAAADLPGHSNGDALDLDQVARAMHKKARTLGDSKGSRDKKPVALLNRPSTLTVTEAMDGASQKEAIDSLVASLLGGQDAKSLTAAAWCVPSENYYDLFALEGTTGLLDLPTIGVARAGINLPSYIGYDAADGAMWVWTEDQDSARNLTITGGSITGGVGTLDFAADHLAAVGDMINVTINGNATASGPRTVLSVVDANTVTVDMTGVPNAAGPLTGTGTRQKGCIRIPCPTWTETRLAAYGLCIEHGLLTDRAFPELTRRYVQLALAAHEHRMATIEIEKIRTATHSGTVVAMGAGPSDAYGDLFNAIALQNVDYRSQHGMSDNVVLELALPTWATDALRSNLAMRAGVDDRAVSDAQIVAEINALNVRPQFLEDYQTMWNGAPRTAWPTSLEFLMWPAGNFVRGNGGQVELAVGRDSTLNKSNDFTVLFTEELRLLARRGPQARRVTVTLAVDGKTGGPAA